MCIPEDLSCPAGSELKITPFEDDRGRQIGTIIHCACRGDKKLCGSSCHDPCPAQHIRNPRDCECKPNCPSPRVWVPGEGGGCKCPEGMEDDPLLGCIRPEPQPRFTLPEPEYQDVEDRYAVELTGEEILDLERAGYINAHMREMLLAGTVDAETVLELKNRLKLDGDGVTRPSGIEGEDGEDMPRLNSNNSRGGSGRTGRGVQAGVSTPGQTLGSENIGVGQNAGQVGQRIQQGLDSAGAQIPQGGSSGGRFTPGDY